MSQSCYCTTIQTGATWSREITWKDSSGNPVDLTGFTGKMQVRSAGALVVELGTADGKMVLGGTAGTITLTLSASDTTALTPGKAVYDLFLTSSGGVATKLLDGDLLILDRVTV